MMKKIIDNVYVESERSVCNNSYVVTKDGVVVIDTPMVPANARAVAAEMAKYGPVRYLVNTEPHGDHISGNCYFGGICIGHEGTRQAILAAKIEDMQGMLKMWSPDTKLDPDFKYRPSDITFSEKLTFYLGGNTFQLIHMPGHSPHQLAVYVPEKKIVFTSDNVVRGMPFFRQAVPDRWLKSLKQLEKLDVDMVVPGHGEPGPKSYIKEMEQTVQRWLDTVAAAIDKGMSVKEAQDNLTMEDMYPGASKDPRSSGVIRMNVERIYEYLKGR
jgi:cyclase